MVRLHLAPPIMRIRRRLCVRGRVQGVGFRDFVRQRATGMGLAGFVRNEADGSVTAEIEGEPQAVQAFLESLRADPLRFARVDDIDVQELAPKRENEFRISG